MSVNWLTAFQQVLARQLEEAGSTPSAGWRKLDLCVVCRNCVFIAERLMVHGRLHHRTCFRCARCSSQLSLANYYETEQGQYCCETCPDETVTVDIKPEVKQQVSVSCSGDTEPQRQSVVGVVCVDQSVCQDGAVKDKSEENLSPEAHADPLTGITSEEEEEKKEVEEKEEEKSKEQKEQEDKSEETEAATLAGNPFPQDAVSEEEDRSEETGAVQAIQVVEAPPVDAVSKQEEMEAESRETEAIQAVAENPFGDDCEEEEQPEEIEAVKDVTDENQPDDDEEKDASNEKQTFSQEETDENKAPSEEEEKEEKEEEKQVQEEQEEREEKEEDAASERKGRDENISGEEKKEEEGDDENVSDDLTVLRKTSACVQPKIVTEYNPFEEDEEPEKEEQEKVAGSVAETVEEAPVIPAKPRRSRRMKASGAAASSGLAKHVTAAEEDYPEELNPFDDDPAETTETTETETVIPAAKTSLNPFGSDDEDEDDAVKVVEPVEVVRKPERPPIPVKSSSSTLTTPSPKKRPAPPPPTSTLSPSTTPTMRIPSSPSPSTTSRKSPAPPPPVSVPAKSPIPAPRTLLPPIHSEKEFKDRSNLHQQISKDSHGQWKRKKGPAPPRPLPQKRQLRKLPAKVIQQELEDIEVKQLELERQGVHLERNIRSLTEPEDSALAECGIQVEEMILQLFDLVNEKNELLRRQTELMYIRRQQRLEEEHAELEFQIRCLMQLPGGEKTDEDRLREEELIQRLVQVVHRRAEIVDCLEMDRRRQVEEDLSIQQHLDVFNSRGATPPEEPIPAKSKSKTLMKLHSPIKLIKKDKSKKSKKKDKDVDADKDVDESESAASVKQKEKEEKRPKVKGHWFAK